MIGDDPLRTRYRPGDVRVEAHSATWESTVFAIAVGSSVRYLEVPADQVPAFLASVDAGRLDGELAAIAVNSTGQTLDKPGRVRAIAAFDRIVRSAVARTERDTATGQLAEPGWKPRKRRSDEDATSRAEQLRESAAQATAGQGSRAAIGTGPNGSAAVGAAGVGAVRAARSAWWQSPVVAVGAVVAVVVVVAGTVFAVTRSSDEPASGAVAGSLSSEQAAVPTIGSGGPTGGGTSNSATAAGVVPATALSAAESSAAVSSISAGEPAASPGAASVPVPSPVVAPPAAPGDGNRFDGGYSFTRTVTENSGNENFAVGASETGTLTLAAACDEPTCALDGGSFGVPMISGDQLAFAGSGEQACPADASIIVGLSFTVTLQASATGIVNGVDKVTALQGVGTLTAQANGCPDAEIKPITYSYDVIRTG